MTTPTDPSAGLERLLGAELTAEPVFLMARAASTGSSAANRQLAQLELKVRHYSVLALACGEEQLTQRELSQFLVLDPSQIVAILDDLERRGAVERRTDPRDRRSKIIAPTAAGRELYVRARALVETSTAESLSPLSPAEREELSRLLRKVAF
ncbi:MarR family transcriptional regulator [Kocuria sp. CPCC 205292]|uniref:MarR family winged helix-turn-helix transcriptional regulator n=1 Tax=Kocuria cellulosilytica TaxID=3071451 RepID=UPI0034D4D5E7